MGRCGSTSSQQIMIVTAMLARTVKKARQKKGLSQQKLAELAGLSRQYVAAVEKGANVSVEVLQRLAAVLGLRKIQLGSVELELGKTPARAENWARVRRSVRKAAELLGDVENLFATSDESRGELGVRGDQPTPGEIDNILEASDAVPLSLETVVNLIHLTTAVVEASPKHAVELTRAAIDLAAELRSSEEPKLLARVIGTAWKEHAFALSRLGRYQETFEALDRAEALLKEGHAKELSLTDVEYIRGCTLRDVERYPEAVSTLRRAASRFEAIGDSSRAASARLVEAGSLFHLGRVQEAREISESLIERLEHSGDLYRLSFVYRALGHFLTYLKEYGLAEQYLRRSLNISRKLKNEPLRVRATWGLALLQAAEGDLRGAVTGLGHVQLELENLGDMNDAALAALDRIDILLALGEVEDVRASCSQLVNLFDREGLTISALTALGFLRQALAEGMMTPETIGKVRQAFQAQAQIPREWLRQPGS